MPPSPPEPHADFHRVLESGRRLFNTVDIGLVATRSDVGFGVLSFRISLGYAKQRTADCVFRDQDWFAVRAQRDASIFGDLLGQTYRGQAFAFDGIPSPCHFVSQPAGWFSNGPAYRGDGLWASPSLRYQVGGSTGRLFDAHNQYLGWVNSIRVRADLHDLEDLIERLRLRQPFGQNDHARQFHFELEYPIYLGRHEVTDRTTRVYFATPHPARAWRMKWRSDHGSGQETLHAHEGSACLTIDGRHDQLEVNALFDTLSVGPFHSRTSPVVVIQPTPPTLPPPASPPPEPLSAGIQSPEKLVLLFLSANPDASSPLKVEKEQARVTRTRNGSKHQDRIGIEALPDVDLTQVPKTMRLHKPAVLHFAGHGSPSGALLMRDHNGHPSQMNPSGVARLIRQQKDVIRLVVLNACFSDALTSLLVEDIDCVVGMQSAVRDEPAILFSESFYGALFDGTSVAYAFEAALGVVEALYDDEAEHPRLRCKAGVDAATVYLVGERR